MAEIAASAPLAVDSIRSTMRGDLATRIRAASDHEQAEQDRLRQTADWREVAREGPMQGPKDDMAFSYVTLERRRQG